MDRRQIRFNKAERANEEPGSEVAAEPNAADVAQPGAVEASSIDEGVASQSVDSVANSSRFSDMADVFADNLAGSGLGKAVDADQAKAGNLLGGDQVKPDNNSMASTVFGVDLAADNSTIVQSPSTSTTNTTSQGAGSSPQQTIEYSETIHDATGETVSQSSTVYTGDSYSSISVSASGVTNYTYGDAEGFTSENIKSDGTPGSTMTVGVEVGGSGSGSSDGASSGSSSTGASGGGEEGTSSSSGSSSGSSDEEEEGNEEGEDGQPEETQAAAAEGDGDDPEDAGDAGSPDPLADGRSDRSVYEETGGRIGGEAESQNQKGIDFASGGGVSDPVDKTVDAPLDFFATPVGQAEFAKTAKGAEDNSDGGDSDPTEFDMQPGQSAITTYDLDNVALQQQGGGAAGPVEAGSSGGDPGPVVGGGAFVHAELASGQEVMNASGISNAAGIDSNIADKVDVEIDVDDIG